MVEVGTPGDEVPRCAHRLHGLENLAVDAPEHARGQRSDASAPRRVVQQGKLPNPVSTANDTHGLDQKTARRQSQHQAKRIRRTTSGPGTVGGMVLPRCVPFPGVEKRFARNREERRAFQLTPFSRFRMKHDFYFVIVGKVSFHQKRKTFFRSSHEPRSPITPVGLWNPPSLYQKEGVRSVVESTLSGTRYSGICMRKSWMWFQVKSAHRDEVDKSSHRSTVPRSARTSKE